MKGEELVSILIRHLNQNDVRVIGYQDREKTWTTHADKLFIAIVRSCGLFYQSRPRRRMDATSGKREKFMGAKTNKQTSGLFMLHHPNVCIICRKF